MNKEKMIWSLSVALAVIAASLPAFMIISSMLGQAGMDAQKVFMASTLSAALVTLLTSYWCKLPVVIGSGITGVSFMTASLLKQGWNCQDLIWLQLMMALLFLLATLLHLPKFVEKAFGPILSQAMTSALGAFLLVIAVHGAMRSLHLETLSQVLTHQKYIAELIGVLFAPLAILILLERKNFPGSYLIAMLSSAIAGYCLKILPQHEMHESVYALTFDLSSLKTLVERVGGLSNILAACAGLLMIQILDVTGCTLAMTNLAHDKIEPPVSNFSKKIFFLVPLGTLFGVMGGNYGISGPHSPHLSSAIGLCGPHKPDYRLLGWMYALLLLVATGLQPWLGQLPFYATLPVLFWVGLNMICKLPLKIKENSTEVLAGWLMVLATLCTAHLLQGVAVGIWSATFFAIFRAKSLSWTRLGMALFLALCLVYN